MQFVIDSERLAVDVVVAAAAEAAALAGIALAVVTWIAADH